MIYVLRGKDGRAAEGILVKSSLKYHKLKLPCEVRRSVTSVSSMCQTLTLRRVSAAGVFSHLPHKQMLLLSLCQLLLLQVCPMLVIADCAVMTHKAVSRTKCAALYGLNTVNT